MFIHTHIYSIYIFLEYTDVRTPSEYCDGKESPPEYLLFAQPDGTFQTKPNKHYNQPPETSNTVNQTIPVTINFFDQLESSTDVVKSTKLNFDLNEPPPEQHE